jgi:transposase
MRFRLCPTPEQVIVLERHCADARFVWNLALEQRMLHRIRLRPSPSYVEQSRQMTEARADNPWLADGSHVVQQQALRDLDQAFRYFFNGTHGYPKWRKRGANEGLRIVAVQPDDIRRLSRHKGAIQIPKIGTVKFRWSRDPGEPKSFRVTRDAAGRWHVAFAVIPPAIEGPGTGEVVGLDRGVAVSVMTSNGEAFYAPTLRPKESERLMRLQRRLSHAMLGSNRRHRVKRSIAIVRAREVQRRKDWIEKTTTTLARLYDIAKVEALKIGNMTRSAHGTVAQPGCRVRQKAGLNRAILAQGWGLFVARLEQKMPGRVARVDPQYTSQRCSECGHVAAESRESQARFRCVFCGFSLHADLNAARNIAGGQPVTARGARISKRRAVNREPHQRRRSEVA